MQQPRQRSVRQGQWTGPGLRLSVCLVMATSLLCGVPPALGTGRGARLAPKASTAPQRPTSAGDRGASVGTGVGGAALPVAAPAEPWTALREAAAHIRTGQLPLAGESLRALLPALQADAAKPGDRSEAYREGWQPVAQYLMARVEAAAGRGKEAATHLQAARPLASVVPASFAFVEVEVALAVSDRKRAFDLLSKLRAQHGKFRWAQADLTWSRLFEALGPPEAAADAALNLYGKSHLHLPQDELLARAARTLHKSGKLDRAHHLWRKLLLRHPESDFVDEAARHVPIEGLSIADRLDRAELLFKRRAYERCRTEAQFLWQKEHRRDITGYLLGKIGSERLRDDYEGAARAFEAAIAPSAPYALQALSSYGIVLGKLGRIDDAVRAFDLWMQRYGGSAPNDRVVELMYDRCRALHIAGQSLRAANEFSVFLKAHPNGIDFGKYWWFVAFWNYQGGNYQAAIEHMAGMLGARNPLVGGKSRYWTAKAYDKLGQTERAAKMLAALVVDMPLTWYSGLAENWLVDHGRQKAIPKRPDLAKVKWRITDPFAGLPRDGAVQRLRQVAHLGEYDTLRDVYAELQPALRAQIGAAALGILDSALSDAMEDVAGERSRALAKYGSSLARWPTPRTVSHWRDIYPRAYATHVTFAATRYGAPEWMVYAHMLQESRYKPWMISGAPAYGLLELLDRTARRLADEQKEDYQLWMLMVPGPNVRWGTQYLGALVKKFHGQLPFAIASYNGGPMLLEYHLRESSARADRPQKDFDIMIDDMGPHECRNYVRMVTGHFLRYLAAYESKERADELRAALLPRTWRAEWLPKPDY